MSAFDKFNEQRRKDIALRLKNINPNYQPFYSKELTEHIEFEVHKALTKSTMFRLFASKDGVCGNGKTASVFRQAKILNWKVMVYDTLTDFNDPAVLNELKNIILGVNDRSTLILFDNIEEIRLPDWFIPTPEEYENKNRVKNKLLDVAMIMHKQNNFSIIVISNEHWRLSKVFEKYFYKIIVKPPDIWVMKRIAKERGLPLPNKFIRDIRQLHFYLMMNGIFVHRPAKENPFDNVRDFLVTSPRVKDYDVRGSLSKFLTYNMFNNKYVLSKHTIDFYNAMVLVCLADRYGDDRILKALPPIQMGRDLPIFFPKTRKKED